MESFSARPDGLITRQQAADLAEVTPDAITAWVRRGHLAVAGWDGKRPLFDQIAVAAAEHKTRHRARRVPSWLMSAA